MYLPLHLCLCPTVSQKSCGNIRERNIKRKNDGDFERNTGQKSSICSFFQGFPVKKQHEEQHERVSNARMTAVSSWKVLPSPLVIINFRFVFLYSRLQISVAVAGFWARECFCSFGLALLPVWTPPYCLPVLHNKAKHERDSSFALFLSITLFPRLPRPILPILFWEIRAHHQG